MNLKLFSFILFIQLVFVACQSSSESGSETKSDEQETRNQESLKLMSGTQILPWTENQQIAKGYGIYLDSIQITECDDSNVVTEFDEIKSIIETDSTLFVESIIIGNCCHDFLVDVQIIDDSVIDLIYYGYGKTYCSCTCCYGLTFKFSKMLIPNNKKLTSIMINSEKKTIKAK